jgi:hypothetical protein
LPQQAKRKKGSLKKIVYTKSQPGATLMGSIGNGRSVSAVGIQMPPEGSKTVLEPESLLVTTTPAPRWRLGIIMLATRAAALVMALLSVSLMVSSKQQGILTIFGIEIPLHANWSFSYSLQ